MKKLISWHDSFSVKNEIIDSQHKKFIDIINKFYTIFKRKGSYDEMKAVLHEIKEYTVYHFTEEEAIMEKASYPYLDEHKISHEKLIEKITNVEVKYRAGEITVNYEMMNLLRSWLTEHILKEDKLYVGFI